MICRMILPPIPPLPIPPVNWGIRKSTGVDGKGPDHLGPGQVKQSGIGGYSALPLLHQRRRDYRAEPFFVALPTSGDLFTCAKNLLVETKAPQAPTPKPLR